MAIRKSVRIYDLAREVKQDTKRVMEDLRRAGADVSVASNSVSSEFAEKVRAKYFPKTEVAPKRAIKVIKASKKKVETVQEEAAPAEVPAAEAEKATAKPAKKAETPAAKPLKTVKVPVEEPAIEPGKTVKVKKLVASKVPAKAVEPAAEPEITVEAE